MVQQFESAISRLGDSVNVEQAKTAVKRHRGKIAFFKKVGESPKAVSLYEPIGFHDGLYYKGCGIGFIVQWIPRIRGRIPLSVIHRLAACLASHFACLFA